MQVGSNGMRKVKNGVHKNEKKGVQDGRSILRWEPSEDREKTEEENYGCSKRGQGLMQERRMQSIDGLRGTAASSGRRQ